MDKKSSHLARFVSAHSGLTGWIAAAIMTIGSLTAVNSAQAQTPTTAELLSGVLGTYNLTFFDADADLFNNRGLVLGGIVTFVVAAGGRLCTPDLNLTDGVASSDPSTNSGAVLWSNGFADLQINLRVVDSNADQVYEFQEIDYRSATGVTIGRFSLASVTDFSSGTGTCGTSISTDPTADQILSFFLNAENTFNTLFPRGPFTFTQVFLEPDKPPLIAAGSPFRFYASTGITLAVSAGQVFAKGGGYGTEFVAVGRFSDLTGVGGVNNIIRPAAVPAFFTGTYETSMSDAQPFSSIADGTEVRYGISSTGRLCLSNRTQILYPVFLNNDTSFAVWVDNILGVSYRQLITAENQDDEIDRTVGLLQVFSLSGVRFGELSGERTSLDAFCNEIDPQHPDTMRAPRIERLFEVKEQLFPELYPASPIVQTQRTTEYTFRSYPQTNRFIAVRFGIVYEGTGTVSFTGASSGELEQVISATTAATNPYVPASFMVGTYDMVISEASPLSSVPSGTRIRMVLTGDGTLCVDNVSLSSPTVPRSALSDVSWTNMDIGLSVFMVAPSAQSALALHLTSSQGDNFGRLDGSRVSTRATCPGAVITAADITAADEFFILAERRFPAQMPVLGDKTDRTASGAITRLYRSTNVSVTIVAGDVFARGGSFGANDVLIGNLTALLPELRAEFSEATQAAVIPPALFGTYDMLVSGGSPTAPFDSNARVRVVVRQNGELCLNNLISGNPRSDYGSLQIANWTYTTSNFIAVANTADLTNGLNINLRNTAGNALGTLTGDRVSSDTFCSAAPLTAAQVQTVNELFMLAERQYPGQLAAGSGTTQTTGPAVRRSYAGSGLVLTVVDNKVFARGGEFGVTEVDVGPADALLTELRTLVGADNRAAVIPAALAGTYDLLVSGANPFAPFANNSRMRVVINNNGELCLNSIISADPRSDYGNLNVATWTNNQAGLVARLDMTDVSGGVAFQISNTAGNSLGNLAGTRVNTDTYCSATALSASEIQTINSFFELAERRSPASFPTQSTNITQTAAGVVWRTYNSSSTDASQTTVLSVVNNQVFVRGGSFGVTDFNLGTLPALTSQWLAEVGAPPAQIAQYNVRVTGNSLVTIAGLSTVNRQLNITRQQTYSQTELADGNLPVIARALLSGEITSPDSTVISNISRSNGVLSFRAILTRTTVVGSSTTFRQIEAQITLSL